MIRGAPYFSGLTKTQLTKAIRDEIKLFKFGEEFESTLISGLIADKQLAIDIDVLRTAIKTWCSGLRYWECLTEDAIRVDLNGEPAGHVSKIEAEQAVRMKARLGNKKSKGDKAGGQ